MIIDDESRPAGMGSFSFEADLGDGVCGRFHNHGDTPDLDRFYDLFSSTFTIESETETLEGFKQVLALNTGTQRQELTGRYGAFCEVFCLLLDKKGDSFGGLNFSMFARQETNALSVNLNYLFVDPKMRGRGVASRVVQSLPDLLDICTPALGIVTRPERYVFLEQNDPFRMSQTDYEQDTKNSGLDQVSRLRIWHNLGAGILDFDYVQPALSKTQEPNRGLVYSALVQGRRTISAGVLARHLESFFAISVAKGIEPENNEVARRQINNLQELERQGVSISVLMLDTDFRQLRGAVADHRFKSLTEYAKHQSKRAIN